MAVIWPRQSECDRFFGNPRGTGGRASLSWERENLQYIVPPFEMHMGNIKIARILVHRKCAEIFSLWLGDVWENAGHNQAKIDAWGMSVFSGGYAFRSMRNGSALSMHAYGCALDFDAPRNGLGDNTPHFGAPEPYTNVVKPFLALGGTWGGAWNRPRDGMHFQLADVR